MHNILFETCKQCCHGHNYVKSADNCTYAYNHTKNLESNPACFKVVKIYLIFGWREINEKWRKNILKISTFHEFFPLLSSHLLLFPSFPDIIPWRRVGGERITSNYVSHKPNPLTTKNKSNTLSMIRCGKINGPGWKHSIVTDGWSGPRPPLLVGLQLTMNNG